jgi:hypothetical protein
MRMRANGHVATGRWAGSTSLDGSCMSGCAMRPARARLGSVGQNETQQIRDHRVGRRDVGPDREPVRSANAASAAGRDLVQNGPF